ncbi:MAG: trypsin-like peptidase domain-containing protein [Oscillospiraceae bacterium]|nr:trypsin-like peptidase domain-containing protein [Oscillospiraceae bacterium]
MDNQWEYDYSNLNSSGAASRPGDTSSYSTDAACGYTPSQPYSAPQGGSYTPPPSQPEPPVYTWDEPQPPKKKKGGAKKVLLKVLSLVLVAAIGFAGGYAGAMVAGGGGTRVVYQTVERLPAEGQSSGSTTAALGLTDVASIVSPSVVVITTEVMTSANTWFGGQYVESGAGSGVVMSEDGYIITNAHVVSGASNVKVTLHDGTEYVASIIGSDAQSDIAVVKIDATGLTPAVMGDSDALAVGETVVAVGNPLGELGGTVTNGIVNALNREILVGDNNMTLIQTNAAVSPGNSGGGLFNAAGELIGIVNAKSTGDYAEGLGFAIPVNTAQQVATDLIERGFVSGRPVLGVTVLTISDTQTAMQYGVSSLGVYVTEVTPGGPAEQAGIQAGDRIVSVEDQLIETNSDLTNLIASHAVGDVLNIQISRGRQLVAVQATLGEKQG